MPDGSLPRSPTLPVAVIGAGPVGLAAAAHLRARGLTPLVLEAGPEAGTAVNAWGHVHMFTPWRFNIDSAARALLDAHGWTEPNASIFPTGAELSSLYLVPLARALGSAVRTNARVIGIARKNCDLMRDAGRDAAPFVLQVAASDGGVQEIEAAAVIDCSGTWANPNPAGSHGLLAVGEAAHASLIAYGVPDVLGSERGRYAGRSVLVVGGGHSAMNVVLSLVRLAQDEPHTRIAWAFRRPLGTVRFGGGSNDGLLERGALGTLARASIEDGIVQALAPFLIGRIEADGSALLVTGLEDGRERQVRVDRMIVATGFRPDLAPLRELRIALDPAVQAPPLLAPLIDPNLHSCGTVRPHGEAELRHPEPGFYIAGMKSYGRAPTFLLATGHEQVRSIVAALAGDWDAARDVRLELPETGVCSGPGLARDVADLCCTPTTPQAVCCEPKPALVAAAPCCGSTPTRASGCLGEPVAAMTAWTGRRGVVVSALGIAQTLAWGSTYYLPAVFADPVCASLHLSHTWFFGTFSAALLVSGLLGPLAGRAIDRRGGRNVLAATNLIFAAGLLLLSLASGPVTLAAAWLVIGIGMGFGLYEAAFATVAGLYGREARSAITGITLFAGFASTVGWPASALFIDAFGWRGACLVWSGLHLLLGLPLNRLLVPGAPSSAPVTSPAQPVPAGVPSTMIVLACVFGATWFVSTALAAHLPRLLEALGVTSAAAIAAGALVGPAQVAARAAEFTLLRRASPIVSARLATGLHPLGAVLLALIGAPAAIPFVLLHGSGNGMLTIARGTLPLAMFGPAGYGLRTGLLAAPARILQGAAPLAFGLVLDRGGPYAALLLSGTLTGLSLLALLLLKIPSEIEAVRPVVG